MAAAIGFAIAIAIALTGVGGGVLTAPILILFLGMPAPEAVGTSLAFVALVKLFAVPAYLRRRQVDRRMLFHMLAGGVPGVVAGSVLLTRAHGARTTGVVLALVGATVLASASLNLLRAMLRGDGPRLVERARMLPLAGAAIGLEVGFSSAGAGALGTVALLELTALPPATVVGTDLVFGFVLSVIGGGYHLALGTLNGAVLLSLALGGVAGALAGSQLAGRFPARVLRAALAAWLLWAGSQLLFRGLGALAR